MGQFKVEIIGVGGHGQDRDKKDGGIVNFYENGNATPDALAKTFVEMLKANGVNVESATITHWPGTEGEVQDDLASGVRKGNF